MTVGESPGGEGAWSAVMVTVMLFAGLSDQVGERERQVELPEGAAVSDVLDDLKARFPEAAGLLEHCMVAVNAEYVDRRMPLRPGDRVALIPPVSGG